MPHLNVEVSEQAMAAARDGASEAGMLLRRYVERVLLAARQKPEADQNQKPELTYGPIE